MFDLKAYCKCLREMGHPVGCYRSKSYRDEYGPENIAYPYGFHVFSSSPNSTHKNHQIYTSSDINHPVSIPVPDSLSLLGLGFAIIFVWLILKGVR